jgi:hypothetical protein
MGSQVAKHVLNQHLTAFAHHGNVARSLNADPAVCGRAPSANASAASLTSAQYPMRMGALMASQVARGVWRESGPAAFVGAWGAGDRARGEIAGRLPYVEGAVWVGYQAARDAATLGRKRDPYRLGRRTTSSRSGSCPDVPFPTTALSDRDRAREAA